MSGDERAAATAVTEPATLLNDAGVALAAGDMVGRYQLVVRLGAGAMGVVWSAEDPQLERRVAIKVVHPSLARSGEAAERLLREARAMAKVSHRAVVTIYDSGEADGRLFLAMEQVEGTTLGQLLRDRDAAARADWRRWLAMMIEAGRGLAAAHAKAILHRDFKPDNVLVETTGRVCVADFGLASLGEPTLRASTRELGDHDLTTTGTMLGTPIYMGPQQLNGEPIDARADQFAFCVATFEALYGARPFGVTLRGAEGLAALLEAIELGAVIDTPASAVPAGIRAVLVRGLAAEPAARWPSLDALLAELERLARPRRWPWYAGGGAALAAIVAGVAILAQPGKPLEPEHLFRVPIRSLVLPSADGKLVLIGSDRLEVRELATGRSWVTDGGTSFEVLHAELDEREVRFSARGSSRPMRWSYRTTKTFVEDPDLGGPWIGDTPLGAAVFDDDGIRIVDASRRVIRRHALESYGQLQLSPDRRRIVMVDASRFSGVIAVWDFVADTTIRSAAIPSLTAVNWLDDNTLVYAAGERVSPTLWRASVERGGLGERSLIYRQPKGWFGGIAVRHDAGTAELYVSDLETLARSRLLEHGTRGVNTHELDAISATVTLGWLDDAAFLAWSRETSAVERRGLDGSAAVTPIRFDGEPLNATRAGRIVIASLRRTGSREVDARSLDTGERLWSRTDLFAVRCAGDAHAPCFALVDGGKQIAKVDPATGKTEAPFFTSERGLEDIAVTEAGDRIYVPEIGQGALGIDLQGARVDEVSGRGMPVPRSIAILATGELAAGGTAYRNHYAIGIHANGVFDVLADGENDIVALVRPSPDGTKLLTVLHSFSPEVLRLTIPSQ